MDLKKRKQEVCENIFLVICGLNIAVQYLKNISMFQIVWPEHIFEYLIALLAASLVLKLITTEEYCTGSLVICAAVVVVCYLEWRVNGGPEILYFALFVIGMQGIKSEKIIKSYLLLSILLLGGNVIAAALGKVENLVYYRGDTVRSAFGTVYPTIFASQILYLYMCYIYIKRQRLKCYDFIFGVILGLGIYLLCGARMSSVCMFLFVFGNIVISCYSKMNKKLKISSFIEIAALCSPALCCMGILTMTILFDKQNRILGLINRAISNRLFFGKEGLELYGVTKWGVNFPQYGNGGTTQSAQNYFYIDSAYVSYLLRYGLIFLLLLIVIMLILNYRVCTEKDWVLLWILVIVAFHGVIEDRLLATATNPFLWMLLSDMRIRNKEEEGIRYIEKRKWAFKILKKL